ncbi:MAG: 50S ribosomal protein L1 [Candidatus Woesearchaeota archaeon]
MDQKVILDAIKKAKSESKERKFTQRFDLVVNLQSLDFKKPEHQIDVFVHFPHSLGKKNKICALVGPELKDEAEKVCDKTITADDFSHYKDNKKELKKLADEFNFFIAQANIMPQVAMVFGRTLGPQNKMPNPKAGCVVPPKTNLKPLYERLQQTERVIAKKTPIVHTAVGNEKMDENEIVENIASLYNQLIHSLPNEENNVKSVIVKLTMGKPVKVA